MSLRIVNWDKFQHYKNRNPPWIRLYKRLLNNLEYSQLSDKSRAILIELWLLASESGDGTITCDANKLAFRLRRPNLKASDLKPLIDLGFLECASTVLASCTRIVPRGETEERQRQRQMPLASCKRPYHGGTVKLTDEEHEKLTAEYGEGGVAILIQTLGHYKDSNGKKYKSDYSAIRSWVIQRCLKDGAIRKRGGNGDARPKQKLCEVCGEAPPYNPGAKRCFPCIERHGDT